MTPAVARRKERHEQRRRDRREFDRVCLADYCARCREKHKSGGAWCLACHAVVMKEIADREAIPPGCCESFIGDIRWSDCPKAHEGDIGGLRGCLRWIREAQRSCRCAGFDAIWKDDPSGASSSWDSVVRAYEEVQPCMI